MGQNNQKDQKGPKMRAAMMLVHNNQKIWSPHNSESAFFLGHPVVLIFQFLVLRPRPTAHSSQTWTSPPKTSWDSFSLDPVLIIALPN